MRLVVLSQKPELYSTRRVVEAAERAGHEVQVIDYLRCSMDITAHKPRVMVDGEEIEGVDAVLPRIAASANFYGTAVVRQFEMQNVFTVNTSQAISRSRDKLRCLQLRLVRHPVAGRLPPGSADDSIALRRRLACGREGKWRPPG